VVKLGKTFSIFVVLTLLILLAPAVILSPVASVAANGGGVVQEIGATLTFSETEPGQWWPFIAGSGGIQPPGPDLEQFTRDHVIAGVLVPGCGFRNYTTGAGSVVGDLVGTVDMAWLTTNFSKKYDKPAQLYHDYGETAHFGWMMGRGHYYEEGNTSNNFTFVFALDFDSDPDITNAVGKGLFLSVEENGIFGNMTDPPEQRHKIIGAFDVTKAGAVYTWDLHLRNYDPSEVFDLGILNVTGGVLQENTDNITFGVDILDYQTDGPQPTWTNVTTNFEEVTWGRDPMKTVNSGHLGANGAMDVSRNTILYLEINLGAGWVRIQGTTGNNIYINDTDTGVRAGDGSKYGELYELLLLYIPDQTLPIGEFFSQFGYTFTSFEMHNASTGWYEGSENFADPAQIDIESAVGVSLQNSIDHSYGLYPHPKVENVGPPGGKPNTTMDVTISGKYFLRAAGAKSGWVPNSGSVDFGPNITVNSYTINTNNPINNTITANITIAADATPGPRVVNVTSCFNYSSGNGVAPYLSGLGSFSVVEGNATLEGHISYISRGTAGDPRWAQPFTVRCFEEGNLNNEQWSQNATTDNNGVFTIIGLAPGTYDIGIVNFTCLSELNTSVTLTNNITNVVDFGTTREGDSNGNDAVTGMDFSILAGVFNTAPAGNPNCDFNRDNAVTGMDFSLLAGNFNTVGPLQGY
jgi:hypothetical protein